MPRSSLAKGTETPRARTPPPPPYPPPPPLSSLPAAAVDEFLARLLRP